MPRAKRKSSTDLQRHVQRAERAGLSLAAYARENDVAVHSLYYARSLKLARPSGFVRVQMDSPVAVAPVAIRLPNGITVSTPMTGSLAELILTLLPL